MLNSVMSETMMYKLPPMISFLSLGQERARTMTPRRRAKAVLRELGDYGYEASELEGKVGPQTESSTDCRSCECDKMLIILTPSLLQTPEELTALLRAEKGTDLTDLEIELQRTAEQHDIDTAETLRVRTAKSHDSAQVPHQYMLINTCCAPIFEGFSEKRGVRNCVIGV